MTISEPTLASILMHFVEAGVALHTRSVCVYYIVLYVYTDIITWPPL